VAQVDLGRRGHRHQASHDLAVMAAELMVVAERRRAVSDELVTPVHLRQFTRSGDAVQRRSRLVPTHERPPVLSVRAGRGTEGTQK
jgi:glucosyl-3-phosphoglycerate synthase